MEAKQLNIAAIGTIVYFENTWQIISNWIDGEYELLSIEVEPQTIYARQLGSNFLPLYKGILPPQPFECSRQCDVMDTVFFGYIGNRMKPVIDWGYYVGQNNDGITLFDKRKVKEIKFTKDSPITKVFYFKELQIGNSAKIG